MIGLNKAARQRFDFIHQTAAVMQKMMAKAQYKEAIALSDLCDSVLAIGSKKPPIEDVNKLKRILAAWHG